MTKKRFRELESEYNFWLSNHPKRKHNYKSFSHMRRIVEFAEYYSAKKNNDQSTIQRKPTVALICTSSSDFLHFKKKDYLNYIKIVLSGYTENIMGHKFNEVQATRLAVRHPKHTEALMLCKCCVVSFE